MVFLDAMAAGRCPVALDRQIAGTPGSSASDVVVKWRDAAAAHRRAVGELLTRANVGALAIDTSDGRDAQEATAAACARHIPVILSPRLPTDVDGRRRGNPDALFRHEHGYLPVIVKRHRVAEVSANGRLLGSVLEKPYFANAVIVHGRRLGPVGRNDALELAHYYRLLQVNGFASLPVGGVIDAAGDLWWIRLDEPRGGDPTRSILATYDREFALRVAVVDRATARLGNESLPPLVIPLHKNECSRCRYEAECSQEMAEADSVSLVPGMQWRHALAHRAAGAPTRAALARLDPMSAHVAQVLKKSSSLSDLDALIAQSQTVPPETPIGHLLGEHMEARRQLRKAGVQLAGDVANLDPATLKYGALVGSDLRVLIERSRAAVSGHPFLARGADPRDVVRADVEIDLDMERADGGTYLWGALVSTSRPLVAAIDEAANAYRAFVNFGQLGIEGEVALVNQLLDWLDDLVVLAEEVGATWSVSYYSHAEIDELRRIAKESGDARLTARVEAIAKSKHWIDLRVVAEQQLVLGHGFRLKKLATLAGFSWRDEDPSGSASMTWYDKAVGAPSEEERALNRVRLLAYNEDDCRATLALRIWLSTAEFEPIDQWRVPGHSG